MAGSFEFSGPPSAVVVNSTTPHDVPRPGDGQLATLSSHTLDDKVTLSLKGVGLDDRAENSFEDVPLFVIDGATTTDEPFDNVFSLYYLNWKLRQVAMGEYKARKGEAPANPRKRATPDYKTEIRFKDTPKDTLTVRGVAKYIRYVGYHIAGMGNAAERTKGVRLGRHRRMTAQLQGRIDHVPNIFVRQITEEAKSRLDEGDMVGFMIKRVTWQKGSTDWEGNATQEADRNHPSTVIQIVPVAGMSGSVPVGNMGDEEYNGDTYDLVYIDNEEYNVKVPAIFIPVGRVVRVSPQEPSSDTKLFASFSYAAYELMKTRQQTVDLQLGIRYPMVWGV